NPRADAAQGGSSDIALLDRSVAGPVPTDLTRRIDIPRLLGRNERLPQFERGGGIRRVGLCGKVRRLVCGLTLWGAPGITGNSVICLGRGAGGPIGGIAGNSWRAQELGMDVVGGCRLGSTLGWIAGLGARPNDSCINEGLEDGVQQFGAVAEPAQIGSNIS